MPCLAQEAFFALGELEGEWRVCTARMKRWLVAGQLRVHVWVPVMSVYENGEILDDDQVKQAARLTHYEGFVPLTPHHCQRLYRLGEVSLRSFFSFCGGSHYQLPDSADDIRARLDDLLVLADERQRFEKIHGLQKNCTANDEPATEAHPRVATVDFRSVELDGQKHYLGSMQAAILQRLYQASVDGEPWQNGKQLLSEVGSESFTLSNVFKHKPVWKKLIESDGRGYYRLRPKLLHYLK